MNIEKNYSCDQKIIPQLKYSKVYIVFIFTLRVRRGDNDNESEQPEYGINTMFSLPVRRNLLDQIRDRRFGRRPSAENNFQLRIRRSPEENCKILHFKKRFRNRTLH